MKPYDSTERCPKCGGMMSKRRYVVEYLGNEQTRERLEVECSACGFSTERATLDAAHPPHPLSSSCGQPGPVSGGTGLGTTGSEA